MLSARSFYRWMKHRALSPAMRAVAATEGQSSVAEGEVLYDLARQVSPRTASWSLVPTVAAAPWPWRWVPVTPAAA
jgi:hypothetical protein